MANTTKFVKNENYPILLDKETIQCIIEKLEELKEIELLYLTDFDEDKATEDRMSNAQNYIECGNLINYLNEKLN